MRFFFEQYSNTHAIYKKGQNFDINFKKFQNFQNISKFSKNFKMIKFSKSLQNFSFYKISNF